MINVSLGTAAGKLEADKVDWKSISKDKVTSLRQLFGQAGANAGREAGLKVGKLAFSKLEAEVIRTEVRKVAIAAAEKYAIKAREFHKMAVRIAEESGAKYGAMVGEEEGAEGGEENGGTVGEKVGREAGEKAARSLIGEEGAKPGGEAGAKAGKRFGLKIGRDTGAKIGEEVGEFLGRKAGGEAGGEEALKAFKIGISKERVMALKRLFAEVGEAAGRKIGKTEARTRSIAAAEEEAAKFALEEGKKAGTGVARKMLADQGKALRAEAAPEGEKAGGEAGDKAGAEAGEKAGADEAERLGAEEGERIGREIAGEEGAKLGREIGAEMARLAGAKMGRKVGATAGATAGRKAGAKACLTAVDNAIKEISRDKVAKLRELFTEIATKAGSEAGARAARAEARKAVQQVAVEAAVKSVREKILGMASKRQIKLSSSWKPTALINVIATRSDLSDLEKIRLAAKAKMEGNLGDILPKKFSNRHNIPLDDGNGGKLKFEAEDKNTVEANEDVDPTKKWKTVVFTELPDEKKRPERTSTKDNVNSLKKRFETSNMKNNEAYVIM